jgi:hypothetical protein
VWDLTEPLRVEALAELVRHAGASLVLADPLAHLHSGTDRDELAMLPLLQGLERLRAEAGPAVFVAHHLRKSPSGRPEDPLDAVRGTTRLRDTADLVTMLDEKRERVRLSFPKIRVAAGRPDVWLSRSGDTGALMLSDPPPARSAEDRDARRDAEVSIIDSADRPLSAEAVVSALAARGIAAKPRTVQDDLGALVAEGRIGAVGHARSRRYYRAEAELRDLCAIPSNHLPDLPLT